MSRGDYESLSNVRDLSSTGLSGRAGQILQLLPTAGLKSPGCEACEAAWGPAAIHSDKSKKNKLYFFFPFTVK